MLLSLVSLILETAAIAQTLTLSHDPWIRVDRENELVVEGASPGDLVRFLVSDAPGSSCPPVLAGGCVDLAAPVRDRGVAVADAEGRAVLRFRVSRSVPPVVRGYAQAIVEGPALAVSNVTEGVTVLPANGPAPSIGVRGGDMEDELGWAGRSSTLLNDSGELVACPPLLWTTTDHVRGTTALRQEGWCPHLATSWPVPVTHQYLAASRYDPDGTSTLGVRLEFDSQLAVAAPSESVASIEDEFSESITDISGACGQEVYIELASTGPVWWDDIQLVGPLCPQYRDLDGDGLCGAGTDLDGDGSCVGLGEHPRYWEPLDAWGYPTLPISVVVEDFEDGVSAWDTDDEYDWSSEVADLTALPWIEPKGAWSGAVRTFAPNTGPFLPLSGIITWDTLLVGHALAGTGDWRSVALAPELWVVDGGVSQVVYDWTGSWIPSPQVWVQGSIDLTGYCGASLEKLRLGFVGLPQDPATDVDPAPFLEPATAYFDDIGLGGSPCLEFQDMDGDGLCGEGVDLDGDGLCVTENEPTPGVVQDGDEP